ncbi:MAG: rhomboid family intramembrane serine protease [Oscillospiraceae bacterium]|nr:rhomboid family intramembrane serine protease [Oscillospiraceae bacterium]
MKNLRRKFEIFCFRHRNVGIPNLMLYISLGSALVYFMGMIGGSSLLYSILCYDRTLILQGQVWRLFSYVLTYGYADPNLILVLVGLVCYFSIGRAMENLWGTLRFNLFYLLGIILQDVFCLIFGGTATVSYLNLSLFLAYATLYPDARFLLLYIIPVKAWIFALVYLVVISYDVIMLTSYGYFPFSLYPLVALLNYFLFFGKDVLNVIPVSWRANARRLFRKKGKKPAGPKVVPFPDAGSYQATVAKPQAPYTHRCTVCGRTDVDSPNLEFRYCSRCKGYYCYCEDHISNHTHVQ